MMFKALAAAALLATPSFAAFAQPGPIATSTAAGGSAPASEVNTRRICRVTPLIGSRLGGTRTCRTKAEWDAAALEARLTADRIQRVSPPCMMGPNDPTYHGPSVICSN